MLWFILHCDPACLTYASGRLQTNFWFVCNAIKFNPRSIEYVVAELQHDIKNLIEMMNILENSSIFYWLYPIHFEKREFVLAAIKHDGFQDTVASYGKSFHYRDDYEVMRNMILFFPSMEKYASARLLRDKEFRNECGLEPLRTSNKKRKIKVI